MVIIYKDNKDNNYYIIRENRHLFVLFFTIPLYVALLLGLKYVFLEYFNVYTSFFVLFFIFFMLFFVVKADLFIKDLATGFLIEKYKIGYCLHELFFEHSRALHYPPAYKKKYLSNHIDGLLKTVKEKHSKPILFFSDDMDALKYYFKINKDSKTIKEIKALIKAVYEEKISEKEAFPYDISSLKPYLVSLYKKIYRFPILSIHDIVIAFYEIRNLKEEERLEKEEIEKEKIYQQSKLEREAGKEAERKNSLKD